MSMKQWLNQVRESRVKRSFPILSFPSISLLDVTVHELTSIPELQARGMKAIADRVPSLASVSFMDLSVEAEAFGSPVRFTDDEVPTVTGRIVVDEQSAEALQIPTVGTGRTGHYVRALAEAKRQITDRPVIAGMIGPFSLAGRLVDVSEAMVLCYDEPQLMLTVLGKVTDFLVEYASAYRSAGLSGVMIAEPLAGLLSPALIEEFSEPFVRRIVDAVQTDDFLVMYHNCGGAVPQQLDSILRIGASAYHFGNAVNIHEILKKVPADVIVMGNVDPASQFRNGTPESVRAETLRILEACGGYPNFIISSGCDIPPLTPWANIDAHFAAVSEYYGRVAP